MRNKLTVSVVDSVTVFLVLRAPLGCSSCFKFMFKQAENCSGKGSVSVHYKFSVC